MGVVCELKALASGSGAEKSHFQNLRIRVVIGSLNVTKRIKSTGRNTTGNRWADPLGLNLLNNTWLGHVDTFELHFQFLFVWSNLECCWAVDQLFVDQVL